MSTELRSSSGVLLKHVYVMCVFVFSYFLSSSCQLRDTFRRKNFFFCTWLWQGKWQKQIKHCLTIFTYFLSENAYKVRDSTLWTVCCRPLWDSLKLHKSLKMQIYVQSLNVDKLHLQKKFAVCEIKVFVCRYYVEFILQNFEWINLEVYFTSLHAFQISDGE